MFLALMATLLILGIAYYQATQGLFSSLIMAILATMAAVLTFNYYEPLGQAVISSMDYKHDPHLIMFSSMMVIFLVSLLGLRELFDRVVTLDLAMGTWPDRIGGGALGVYSGIIVTGVLTLAAQMLPWDASLLTYRPYSQTLQRSGTLAPFYPDEAVMALMNRLRGGSLRGENDFLAAHDNYRLELLAQRNRVMPRDREGRVLENQGGLGARIDAPPNQIKITAVHRFNENKLPEWLLNDRTLAKHELPPCPQIEKGVPTDVYVVRFEVSSEAKERDFNWLLLPATHFRLISDKNHSYYPLAYLTTGEKSSSRQVDPAMRFIVEFNDNEALLGELRVQRRAPDGNKPLIVDWIYRLPKDEKPSVAVFRMLSTAGVGEIKEGGEPDRDTMLRHFIAQPSK